MEEESSQRLWNDLVGGGVEGGMFRGGGGFSAGQHRFLCRELIIQ